MTTLTTPEKAITSFEKWSQTSVTIHDLKGELAPFLGINRMVHKAKICNQIKISTHGQKCFQLEIDQLRQNIYQHQNGLVHTCHAGLTECIYPIFQENILHCILFAGPLYHVADQEHIIKHTTSPAKKTVDQIFKNQNPNLYTVDILLEGLRQLACRLKIWLWEYKQREKQINTVMKQSRKEIIFRFIRENFNQEITLQNLAKELSLSPSRTAHLVKELFGDTLINQVMNFRLEQVCFYLQNSNLTIENIAKKCGFNDMSHFYRCFQKKYNLSPKKYQKQLT